MKKSTLLTLVLIAFGFLLFAMPVAAVALPLDQLIGTTTELRNSSPETEYNWLRSLVSELPQWGDGVGMTRFEDPVTNPPGTEYELRGFNPGFEWEYAVLKYNGTWVAYRDSTDDDLLCTEVFNKGISHVSFVTEPATMLLLGFGLIGLAAFGRKRFFRGA